MSADLSVTVTDPERAALFERVFGSATVPVISPLPRRAKLPGLGERLVFLLDLALLTPEQRARLCAHLAETFGGTAAVVDRLLDDEGMPILADSAVVELGAIDMRLLI